MLFGACFAGNLPGARFSLVYGSVPEKGLVCAWLFRRGWFVGMGAV